MPKTAVLFRTASALFLFATYQFCNLALHQNRASGISLPKYSIPALGSRVHPYAKFYVDPQGPKAPVKKNDIWGMDGEAGLITLSPLIDPIISQKQQKFIAWVVSESTLETCSLLHGLKAVYIPHLVAFNLEFHAETPEDQGKELDNMANKGLAWNPAGGEHAGLLWCSDIGLPEHQWLSASYFYWAGDAPRLWWEYTNGSCTHHLVLHPIKSD